MFRQLYQIFPKKIQPLYSRSRWAIALLLLALCASCSFANSSDVSLKLSVQSATRPGAYNVTGSTNLPDRSQITVSAVRYLFPTDGQLLGPDPNATYSILDRQIAEVTKGQWQANLNLWQVAPDGRLRETWQLNQSQTGLAIDPAPEVSFVATFDPANQRSQSQQQRLKNEEIRGSLVRFTTEGQPYVQASQTLPVALPVGRKAPPKFNPDDINYGWGNRYKIQPEPPVTSTMPPQPPKTDRISTPLSPSEFLR